MNSTSKISQNRSRSRSRSRSPNRRRDRDLSPKCRRSMSRSRSRSRSNEMDRRRWKPCQTSERKRDVCSPEMLNCDEDKTVYRIPPYHFMHALDINTNVTMVEIGPKTFIRKDNVRVILKPQKMTIVPPRHYCIIRNPVCRDNDGNPQFDSYGQIKLQHADREIRLAQEPFPLYPGEIIDQSVCPLKVIPANAALHIQAILDFEDQHGVKRNAGDEWFFKGPGTYIPKKEEEIKETIRATIIGVNEALRLRARKDFEDCEGINRVTGEEWQVKKVGAYMPGPYEIIVRVVKAYVLSETKALHISANRSFVDDFGKQRKNGEQWIITFEDTDTHILHVYETLIAEISILTLTNRQYCVILNPVDEEGKQQFGRKKLVRGEQVFFLQPGEKLEKGIQNVYVLSEEQGLILKASESFTDGELLRQPGDKWMIRGPAEYVPPVQVEVVTKRFSIALDDTEGIYVRNMKTGKVRSIFGQTYMLNQDEELWEKELSPEVEELLCSGKDPLADRSLKLASSNVITTRDKSRIVTLRVPHNAAVQIYDYKEKKSRVVYGPDLVMLGSDEQFTQLSLSGGKPKKPNAIRALCLLLGPDFCTDKIVVETADHAKLSLQLSYNWNFDVSAQSPSEESAKLFCVPDFIGDFCKSIASKVRGAVAQVPFDELHKKSSYVISSAVFGEENGVINHSLRFPQNNLVITNVDIQSVEPVDQRTRDSLQRSVQLAIEITTNSQEAAAKHEAQRLEQEAQGNLERQKIVDESQAEIARQKLLELQALSTAVESTGHAKAEAQSKAETSKIEGQAAVERAKLQAEADNIESQCQLNKLKRARTAELSYVEDQIKLEISKSNQMADIEVRKFRDMVDSIGSNTLLAMATAGPDMQVRMLQALGLKSTLITDGSSPINLFNTAAGLIGGDMIPAKRRKMDDTAKRSSDDDDSESMS